MNKNLKLIINDTKKLNVIYIDDLIDQLIPLIDKKIKKKFFKFKTKKIDRTSVGEIFDIIYKIKNQRKDLSILDLKKS